ncbi:trans-sulfuration enzyme family protein [Patescibacteria group bacterium]
MSNPKILSPQTEAICGFYDPMLSEGAIKPPYFGSSTFVARTAEELAHSFRQAYGIGQDPENPDILLYSRVVNPNLEIFERRFARFEQAEEAAVFSSGMAAISTTLFALTKPGDTVLYSAPVYGGTDYLLTKILPSWGVKVRSFPIESDLSEIRSLLEQNHQTKVIFMESPANPTLKLADIEGICSLSRAFNPKIKIVVDNTVLGPIFQQVLPLGADLAVFSATKMIGGHSDLVAGIAAGDKSTMTLLKGHRTVFGTINDAHAAWLLTRSLETLQIRAQAAQKNAQHIVSFLSEHAKVKEILYPGLDQDKSQLERYQNQCQGSGSLLSFRIDGGLTQAYQFLNALKIVHLAVSLGGTESLAEHPQTHTHSDVGPKDQEQFGITTDLIRLSIGIEDTNDLINDLIQALNAVQ